MGADRDADDINSRPEQYADSDFAQRSQASMVSMLQSAIQTGVQKAISALGISQQKAYTAGRPTSLTMRDKPVDSNPAMSRYAHIDLSSLPGTMDPLDPTTVNATRVELSVKLDDLGLNYEAWLQDLISCCNSKGKHCGTALYNDLKNTAADGAVITMITASVSEEMRVELQGMESANAIFSHIRDKYTGGHNLLINREWEQLFLTEKLQPGQTFRQFVARKVLLQRRMELNGLYKLPDDLPRVVFRNLPPQFSDMKRDLVTQNLTSTAEHIVNVLKAAAEEVGYTEGSGSALQPKVAVAQVPAVAVTHVPAVAVAQAPVFNSAASNSTPNGSSSGSGSFNGKCYRCGERGHSNRNCRAKIQILTKHSDASSSRGQGSGASSSGAAGKSGLSSSPHALGVFDPGIQSNGNQEVTLDGGANIMLVHQLELLHEPTFMPEPLQFNLATSAKGGAVAVGSICLSSGQKNLWIRDVYCDPKASQNLLSMSVAVDQGMTFKTNDSGEPCELIGPDGHFCSIVRKGGLYVLKGVTPVPMTSPVEMPQFHVYSCRSEQQQSLADLWHKRLAHTTKLNQIVRGDMVQGIPEALKSSTDLTAPCLPCIQAKAPAASFPKSKSKKPTAPLQILHLDTSGRLKVAGTRGERYFVSITDGYSGYKWVLLVQNKAMIPAMLIVLFQELRVQTGRPLLKIRSDRGTEFVNQQILDWCSQEGVKPQTSCSYWHQQNGVAERSIRTLKDRAKAMMFQAGAPKSMWTEAIQHAAYVSNFLPVEGKQHVTPHEAFWGEKPDGSHLRVWGCAAMVPVPDHLRSTWDPKWEKGMFVGMDPGTKGWRVKLQRGTVTVPFARWMENESGASRGEPKHSRKDLSRFFSDYEEEKEQAAPAEQIQRPSTASMQTQAPGPSGRAPKDSTILTAPSPNPSNWNCSAEEQLESEEGNSDMHHHPSPTTIRSYQEISTAGETMGQQHKPLVLEETSATTNPGENGAQLPTPTYQEENGAQSSTTTSGADTSTSGSVQPQQSATTSSSDSEEADEKWERLKKLAGVGKQQRERRALEADNKRWDRVRAAEGVTDRDRRLWQREARKQECARAVQEAIDAIPVHENGFEAISSDEDDGSGSEEEDGDVERVESSVESNDTHNETAEEGGEGTSHSHATVCQVHAASGEATQQKSSGECREKPKRRVRFALEISQMSDSPAQNSAQPEELVARGDCVRGTDGTAVDCTYPTYAEVEQIGFVPRVCSATGAREKVEVPKSYKEARESAQWDKWRQAMEEELESLNKHGTYHFVRKERDMKLLSTHWVYALKYDSDGNVVRYKARLVAGGHQQVMGRDVNEVFAPTMNFASRRTLLSLAATLDLEIHQVDIKTAFLHGTLEEDVFVRQPPGFDNGDPATVCKLDKALYGLRQAPRQWWKRIDKVMGELGFTPCRSDAGLYVNQSDPENPIFVGIFVDDMLICCKTTDQAVGIKEQLSKLFEIHDLGEVNQFLGCHIVRDREKRTLYMRNTAQIDSYVESFGLDQATHSEKVPMSQDFVVTKEPSTVVKDEEGVEYKYGAGTYLPEGNRYNELVGSLLYIANATRPDIALAVGVLSRYRAKPTTAHWNAALKVLKYLKSTRTLALKLGGGNTVLEAYTDADFATCLDTRKSVAGMGVKVMGGMVSWGAKKQSTVATSTLEAEFQAASIAIKEVNWLRGLLGELGVKVREVPLHCDSNGCLTHLKDPLITQHTKHIAIKFHFTREAVAAGEVTPRFVGTRENMADAFTKALGTVDFLRHRDSLGVVELPDNLITRGSVKI